jgi:hypothetical protein
VFAVVVCHRDSLRLMSFDFCRFLFNRPVSFAVSCQIRAITRIAAATTELRSHSHLEGLSGPE